MNEREMNIEKWKAALSEIFGGSIPGSRVWADRSDILHMLRTVAGEPGLHDTYLPGGSRAGLTRAEPGAEAGCLALHFEEQPVCIVKPEYLSFEYLCERADWSYFRLQAADMADSGWYQKLTDVKEELIELRPGEYIHRSFWERGTYEMDETGSELPFPREARMVDRYLKGVFVIFSKGSAYRDMEETHKAFHAKMSAEAFRAYVSGQLCL